MYTNIKSFEDACRVLNISTVLPDFSFVPESDRQALTDHYKLVIIAKAVNGDWTPDWNNEDQAKYYPRFDTESGFTLYLVDACYQSSRVGSRLCFFSSDAARYVAEQFPDLYKNYFIK